MKTIFYFVKYTPVVFGILMLIHCVLLVSGEDSEILKEFFSFGWMQGVVFTIMSYKLNLCIIHRTYIWYDCLMDLCIKAQRYDLFSECGCDVEHIRIAMLVIGVIIQLLLIYKMYGCKKCQYRAKRDNRSV